MKYNKRTYLSFQRRHIRSLGTLRRFEMVFFKLSIVSSLLTLSSNWPPVVGATVSEMMGSGSIGPFPEVDDEDDRCPQRQVGPADDDEEDEHDGCGSVTAEAVLSTFCCC